VYKHKAMHSPFSSSSWALSLLLWRTWRAGWCGMSPFPCSATTAVPTMSCWSDDWELLWLVPLWWWWWWWCFFLFFIMIFRFKSDGGGRSVPGSSWKKKLKFISHYRLESDRTD
jgi:hypothetical protein